jgi:diaminohydroxyphosphoribosylaminopyrimidine deaminase / 5-amino-6-(5-phosphoribosylamino)uracil reductase
LRYRPTERSPKHPGLPTAITGEAARNWVHAVRAEVDAVLVGVSTVLADDPELTCRLPGLAARSPVRVVSDSRASMPPDSRLARSAGIVPVWLLTLAGEDEPQARALAGLGVVLIACAPTGDGKVDLADALHRLAERGINRVLAEGGARMARALIEADLVDEVYLISASKELGAAGSMRSPACRSARSRTAMVSGWPARKGLGKTF